MINDTLVKYLLVLLEELPFPGTAMRKYGFSRLDYLYLRTDYLKRLTPLIALQKLAGEWPLVSFQMYHLSKYKETVLKSEQAKFEAAKWAVKGVEDLTPEKLLCYPIYSSAEREITASWIQKEVEDPAIRNYLTLEESERNRRLKSLKDLIRNVFVSGPEANLPLLESIWSNYARAD